MFTHLVWNILFLFNILSVNDELFSWLCLESNTSLKKKETIEKYMQSDLFTCSADIVN